MNTAAHRWLLVAALYFAQGIPLGLAMEALPALLRRQGAPLTSLAFLPLVGLPDFDGSLLAVGAGAAMLWVYFTLTILSTMRTRPVSAA